MNIGDYLLKTNKLTQKQREKAELEHEVTGNKFGKCCLDLGFITRTELNQALKAVQKHQEGEVKTMAATEIGEQSKFTFDLEFLITIGAVIISACGTYFTITGQIKELANKESPSRLEFTHLSDKVEGIESNGDLKLITYQLGEFEKTFDEIKSLSVKLTPLASDLEYIKKELDKLKNKKIDIPNVDLSGINKKLDDLKTNIEGFEERLIKVEKNSGGRF